MDLLNLFLMVEKARRGKVPIQSGDHICDNGKYPDVPDTQNHSLMHLAAT